MPAAPWRDESFRAALRSHLARFAGPDDGRGWREVLLTLGACLGALAVGAVAFARGWWLVFGAAVPVLALLQVRVFLLHHDLCHGSLFRDRSTNRAVALLLGPLASTSSSVWDREHQRHHRDSNDLDRSQDGQTGAWTVAQYRAAPAWQRALYRVVNQPLVLFGLVPPLYFLGFMRLAARWYENVLFAAFAAALWWTGAWPVFGVALFPATWFGFLLFHAQHTGHRLVRRRAPEYDFIENGLVGSTCLVGPPIPGFAWFLYGVEYHHVHHLAPGIPAWRQRTCHDEGGALFAEVPRLTLWDAVKATRLVLYDEARGRLITFAEARLPHGPARAAEPS